MKQGKGFEESNSFSDNWKLWTYKYFHTVMRLQIFMVLVADSFRLPSIQPSK